MHARMRARSRYNRTGLYSHHDNATHTQTQYTAARSLTLASTRDGCLGLLLPRVVVVNTRVAPSVHHHNCCCASRVAALCRSLARSACVRAKIAQLQLASSCLSPRRRRQHHEQHPQATRCKRTWTLIASSMNALAFMLAGPDVASRAHAHNGSEGACSPDMEPIGLLFVASIRPK